MTGIELKKAYDYLYSKVGLGKGYLRLARVAILSHKIAGVTSKQDVVHISKCTTSQLYLFIDVNK